jgi:hypothetical protein
VPIDLEQLKRWRLVLGKDSQEALSGMGGGGGLDLSEAQREMDEALAAIYGPARQPTGRPDG